MQEELRPIQTQEKPPIQQSPMTPAQNSNPGILVLQWLTYAFWGWTILALAWLTAVSVSFFVHGSSSASSSTSDIAYPLAATIVLFFISLVCDVFYKKHDAEHKRGASMVIMIIHAVIFALFGIGALIMAVFSVVRLLIGDSDSSSGFGDDGTTTTLVTGIVIAVVYAATLLRTLKARKKVTITYWIFMGIVSITLIILAITGPVLSASKSRDDRLIVNNLGYVSTSIQNYADKNEALPPSLATIKNDLPIDAQTLIDRNLVQYTPEKAKDTKVSPLSSNAQKSFEYELCVTYVSEAGTASDRAPFERYPSKDRTSPNTYYHDAGRVCYDLQTAYVYE